jgi:hypothetical protein
MGGHRINSDKASMEKVELVCIPIRHGRDKIRVELYSERDDKETSPWIAFPAPTASLGWMAPDLTSKRKQPVR